MRARVDGLTKQIAKDCPGLTIHDITHLDGLWRIADLIAGPHFKINPLEAFLFGAAVLLHDAAMCLAAFSNGIDDLKNLPQWRDSVADLYDRNGISRSTRFELIEDNIQQDIIFSVLRKIHAEQSANLVRMEFVHPAGSTFHLLEEPSIRLHYGGWIGKLSASHHWDIERVESECDTHVGPMPQWPSDWTIDPLKLAVMLRCADAAHLDQARAPDFLLALLRPRGLSLDHWKAQNRLAQPILDPADSSALLFSSPSVFPIKDRAAWWIAYDAIAVVQNEIFSSNNVLRRHRKQEFAVRRVIGASDARVLSEYLRPDGWVPVDVRIKVSNVARIARELGGEALYESNDPAIVIRELVQNAMDAISARRTIDSEHEGSILISVAHSQEFPDKIRIDVADDGIGMSERVLTGPLIDFGASLWTSSLMETEFPGLRGSLFSPIGKFGIGFFSVFMVSDQVTVETRRYDTALREVLTLSFENGLDSRPLLIRGNNKTLGKMSTCASFLIKKEGLNQLIETERQLRKQQRISLRDRLAGIFPTLDCDLSLREFENAAVVVHHRNWRKLALRDWLGDIYYERASIEADLSRALDDVAPRLRPIIDNSKHIGLAAIGGGQFSIVHSVGGISDDLHVRPMLIRDQAFGYAEAAASRASRDHGMRLGSKAAFAAWATEQANLIEMETAEPEYLMRCAMNVCDWGGDPSKIAIVQLNSEFARLYSVVALLESGRSIIFPVDLKEDSGFIVSPRVKMPKGTREVHRGGWTMTLDAVQLEPTDLITTRHIVYNDWRLGGPAGTSSYFHISPFRHKIQENSFFGTLVRACESKGLALTIDLHKACQLGTFSKTAKVTNTITKKVFAPAIVLSAAISSSSTKG